MASNVINRFSTIKRTILTLAGKVTLKDVLKANGRTGKAWVGRVTDVRDQVDDKYEGVAEFEIKGAKAHDPSSDPTANQKVIPLAFNNHQGVRYVSGHVYEDGSYKLLEGRAGKGKGKRGKGKGQSQPKKE